MARTILGSGSPALDGSFLTTRQNAASSVLLSAKAVEDRLRQRRSSAYVKAMTKLDAGGYAHTRDSLDALLAAIRSELPELTIEHLPLGIVARCRLGPPYEVHTLDRDGTIIRHFKTFETLPALMERARALALHPGYAFIEVYAEKLIAVADNGDTSIVKG
jgi:hypothetical protein